MQLFRVSLKSKNTWDDTIRNLYVIEKDKDSAREYVNQYKKEQFVIHKIYHLGYELGARMFRGGKEKPSK